MSVNHSFYSDQPHINTVFALKLLGGVALANETGPLTGRAVQKRRLALVARLVLAPQRTLSRDKIIALLWPESDSEQARHLLSVALHELRRTLGVDVIQSRADDLTLSPQHLTSDVEAFEAAVQRGDAEAAIALYEGPFMDGFFATDAPELEEWIQSERNRLSREYAVALEQAARARVARGDHIAGVEAWRRLAALEPFNTRVARELMLALDAAGDRAAALQHARVHTTLLKEEFGAEPDPEIAALAEQLRSAPVTPARAAPAIVPPVTPTMQPLPVPTVTRAPAPAAGGPAPRSFPTESPRRRARRRTRWMISTAALIALIAAPFVWLAIQGGDDPSIAVLPFRSTTPSDSLQLFGEGVAGEIIGTLTRVERLSVAARTSSFSLEDSLDVREVARRLNVGAVLEGTVQRSAERVKVNTTLVNARTGYTIWSDEFERAWNIDDVIGIVEEIAREVARALTVQLMETNVAGGKRRGSPRNIAAQEAYFRGRKHFDSRTPESLQAALAEYTRAIREDSEYALAYAGQAEVLVVIGAYDYGGMPPRSAFPAAMKAVEAALAIDSVLPEAHAALGNIRFNYEWKWEAAAESFRRSLEYGPGKAQTRHWYSLLLAARNDMAGAFREIDRAVKLDPISPVVITSFGRHFYFARDFNRALEQYRSALEIDENYPVAHAGIGTVFVQLQLYDSALAHYDRAAQIVGTRTPLLRGLTAQAAGLGGDTARALAELGALKAAARTSYISPDYFALAYMGLRDYPNAIASLERSFEAQSGSMAYLNVEPAVDSLRNYPAFKRLVAKVRL